MKKRKKSFYTEEFKWKVVKDVLSEKMTKEEARRIYNIRGKSAILYDILFPYFYCVFSLSTPLEMTFRNLR